MDEYYYKIRVEGHLEEGWSDWSGGLTMRHEPYGEGQVASTVLSGPMDQARLHGTLRRIRDLTVPLISVDRLEGAGATGSK